MVKKTERQLVIEGEGNDIRIHDRVWLEGYEKISRLAGIPLREAPDYSYGLITDEEDKELFGKVGVYLYPGSFHREHYFKFGKKEVLLRDDQVYWATNVLMILEEMDGLEKLF